MISDISIRVTSRTSDNFREARFDVKFGVELKNVGLVMVRQGLKHLDQDEIFVQNCLKVNFQHFFSCICQFFFLSRSIPIYLGQYTHLQVSLFLGFTLINLLK